MTIKIGSMVVWNCIEGFGGRALVVGEREPAPSSIASRWMVRMVDGSHPDTWALDGELTEVEMTRDDVVRATADHIRRVGGYLIHCAHDLTKRAVVHDASKWSEREWPGFADATPQLAGLTYGSDEYKAALRKIDPSIKAHYAVNDHHPEHHASGIDGMSLFDLIEMLCDWKAAGERHANGSMLRSFEVNRDRFKISPQLEAVMRNTADAMGWLPKAVSQTGGPHGS